MYQKLFLGIKTDVHYRKFKISSDDNSLNSFPNHFEYEQKGGENKIKNKNIKFLLGISLAVIMLIGFTPLGFSEPLRIQLEQGIESDQLQCNNDSHVLVIRTNGNMACVTENTSVKLGWKIIDNNKLSILKIDLTGIPIKSDVLVGDYKEGLWSESRQGLTRSPAPSTFLGEYNYVVTPDGLTDFSVMRSIQGEEAVSIASSPQNNQKQVDEYLKYFPQYLPDGQELKFFTFEGHEEHAKLFVIYAPIQILVDPQELTMGGLQDIGGIVMEISESPDGKQSSDNFQHVYEQRGFIIDDSSYPPHTLIHNIIRDDIVGGMITWTSDSNINFEFRSMSYTTPELLQMAENALGYN